MKTNITRRFTLGVRNIAANESHADVQKVQQYLKRFGYLRADFQPELLDVTTQEALRIFQRRTGLPETGVVDSATASKLEEPRCGVPDISTNTRLGLFDEPSFKDGCKYESIRQLTYAIINRSQSIRRVKATREIRAAFDKWQSLIPIDFVEVDASASPTLTIGWFIGDHHDGAPFDGAGNVLAHAFPPPHCGDPNAGKCHFDDDELWSDLATVGFFDLQVVGLHEIGHLLGIGHLKQSTSVMNESFAKSVQDFSPDDAAIPAVQALYGRRGPSLMVLAHFQGFVDRPFRDNELTLPGASPHRLEGFQLAFNTDRPSELGLQYMAHVDRNDTPFVSEGQFIGTRSQGGLMTGFAVELIGSQADKYNVLYMAKIQEMGATALHRNGEFCGDRSLSKPIEAILVRVEPR